MGLVARRAGGAWALCACALLVHDARSAESLSEYGIKAAYLYYFATFVEWPAAPSTVGTPFVVGVLGEDPFGPVLEETLRGKAVGDRPFVVRRLRRAKDARECAILFVSPAEGERLEAILEDLAGAPVLTVGDTARFVQRGGHVGLWMEGKKVRFEIGLAAVERSGLKVSSQLLKLAAPAPVGG
ncbi:MAG TPA: YfiR family protein [Candidatus Polarisedimenticolaceae bacterium]|nr:YfiR family protein [Candidatus Polarisedimenticolaceae bacterium]